MEQYCQTNRLSLSGRIKEGPHYSHTLYGEAFYQLQLAAPRLSGIEDVLPVTVSERLLNTCLEQGEEIEIIGQLRSYNKYGANGSRLFVTAFARAISPKPAHVPYVNEVILSGFICKPPVYRTTPFQREITDFLLAVNRSYHKSDYLPVIAWGRNAHYVGAMDVGSALRVSGRLQSREYQKAFPDGRVVTRTAYEVSAACVEKLPEQADGAESE